jgi:hypothetical protein
MGLLATLDLHKQVKSDEAAEAYPEVEYRLITWGEIYPLFLGDREHSIAARYILRDLPFKLFSVSSPYSRVPQSLALTFRAPYEVKKESDVTGVAGIFADETAKEFAAFVSLITRRRVFAVRQTRYDGLPLEQDSELYQRAHYQEGQRLKEINPDEIYCLLWNLQAMQRSAANAFVLAMRLYHSAVEMMYTEPEFSYLFLVMCLEAISSAVYKDYKPSNEGDRPTELEEFLDSRFPGLGKLIDPLPPEKRSRLVKVLLHEERFIFRKMLKFIMDNVPEIFFAETEDDAKPDYLTSTVRLGPDGLGKEEISHSDITIRQSERIEKADLKRTLRNIYDARSRLIHEGIRLPESIVVGHFRSLPPGAAAEMAQLPLPLPPLITFERLVSYSMVEFLRKL